MFGNFPYLLLVIATLLSCNINQSKHEEYTVEGYPIVKEYYSNGVLKNKKIIIDSTKKTYAIVSYYPNGHFHDSSYYVHTKAYGQGKVYNMADSTTCYMSFVNGERNGLEKCYYYNGTIQYTGATLNGNQIGEWNFFYPDGHLSSYEFFTSNGNRVYLRKYNKEGQLIKLMGNGIINFTFPPDSIFVNDYYITTATLAMPPNCEVSLNVGEADTVKKTVLNADYQAELKGKGDTIQIVKNGKYKFVIVENYPVMYIKKQYYKSGKFNVGFLWRIKDLQTGKIEEGMKYLPLVVLNK